MLSNPNKVDQLKGAAAVLEASAEDLVAAGLQRQVSNLAADTKAEGRTIPPSTVCIRIWGDDIDARHDDWEELVELALKLKMLVEHTPFEARVEVE